MSKANAWRRILLNDGTACTVTTITGTTCPCMTYRPGSGSSYSPQYHLDYPAAENCNGTGLISRTTTTVNAKGLFYTMAFISNKEKIDKERLQEIGELNNDDLFIHGLVNTSTGVMIDLTALTEQRDYITFNSINYVVRHLFRSEIDENICHLALLKRKT